MLRRLAGQAREPMALLLLAAAVVSGLALGEVVDACVILAMVVLNAVIALIEEGRASRALAALRAMAAPTATVVRDGEVQVRPATEVVPGDLVVFGAGDRVAADIELLDGSLEVDESILTGESLPVAHRHDAASALWAGTFVVRGSGTGRVRATGAATRLGGIAARIDADDVRTPLQRELAAMTGRLGVAALVIAAAVFVVTALRFDDRDAFLAAVALAVAAVPEGLATVTALGLALGVRRMAAHGAVIRRLPAVETLGATTVIVTDKTGTLTAGTMAVSDVALPGGRPAPVDELTPTALARVAEVALGCNAASLDPPTGDAIDRALLAGFAGRDTGLAITPAVDVLPFHADRDRMATLHSDGGRWTVLVKGSPEAVLERCVSAIDADGAIGPLDATARAELLGLADELATTGARVIALARRHGTGASPRLVDAEDHLSVVALVAMRDPVRPEAARAVEDARRAGVDVIMATGDHAGTAAHVARRVGIDQVHARVDPVDKLRLVEVLQEQGHVVAVTGDGVNDAPALRRADIGIAMGRGSEVARHAADMVLTDDNLATIVAAVSEGRRINERIRRVIQYLIGGNLSEIALVLGALALFPDVGAPLLPVQLLWVNLLTDGAPALALGTAPGSVPLMWRGPRGRDEQLLAFRHLFALAGRGAVIAGSCLAAMVFVARGLDRPFAITRTVGFTALVLAHVLYAVPVAIRGTPGFRPDRRVVGAVAASIALQVVVLFVPPLQSMLHTVGLSGREWAAVVLAGVTPSLVIGTWDRRNRDLRPQPTRPAGGTVDP
jgi:Ca2+-transporting ATPase